MLLLTVTHQPFDSGATNPQTTTRGYLIVGENSALTVAMSTTCQTMTNVGRGCVIEAALRTIEAP